VLAEAGRLREEPEEADKAHRVDLRKLPFVTIDGEDARDFDDAVYCEKRMGGWRLWVAIADVSHYVAVGSALDEEAIQRGNSVYFPEKVVPMLPGSAVQRFVFPEAAGRSPGPGGGNGASASPAS
jgi:ribonuclease R